MIGRMWHGLWRPSIRWQLIAGVALVHMLLMTVFLFDLVHCQRRYLQERARNRVQSQAQLLANSLHGTLSHNLEEIVAAVTDDRYVQRAMVTDASGRVLAPTDKVGVGLFREDERTLAILSGPARATKVYEGDGWIESAAPIFAHGQAIGWAWVMNDLTPDQAHLADITRSGLLCMAAAILLGTLFAMWIARTVTRPMRLLLDGAERLAKNRLDQPVPITTGNEVGLLAERFNDAMSGLARQQSERKEVEEAQRRSEALYRAIAQNIPNGGIWVIDRNLRCLVADGSLLHQLGSKRTSMEGRALHEMFDRQLLTIVEPRFQRALAGEATSYETEFRGRVYWAHYLPLRSENEEVIAVMVVALDISERKRMEQDLRSAKEAAEEASRAKSEFLANMSHELRTPMTVIMSSLDLLRNSDSAAEQRRHFVDMADISAHRLLGIIEDLLDISRIEAGRLRIEERPFALRDCVRESVEMFAAPALERVLRLHLTVEESVPELMHGDPDRIGQILVNLIGNAVKFTDCGEVAVTVANGRGGVDFTIRDTGIGIPAGKMGLLFRPFTQVDSSLARRHGGTGLGLAICKELVSMMGGTIRAESEEGLGSTFTVTLPLRAVHGLEQISPAENFAGEGGRPVRILLAEDDPKVREVVLMMLRQRLWEVVTAENGRLAVARWEEGGIDLLLMDLQMPGMNGIEATRMIRQREGPGARVPIIALTAHVRPENREECLAAGMDGFLAKPIRMSQLYSLIDGSLAARAISPEQNKSS